jgi:hypothetical protein
MNEQAVEAITYLQKQKPVSTLVWSDGMAMAA